MASYIKKAIVDTLAPSMRSPAGFTGWLTRWIMRTSNPVSTDYAIQHRLNLKSSDVYVGLGAAEGAGLQAILDHGGEDGARIPSRIVLVEISADFRNTLNELVKEKQQLLEPNKVEIHEEDCKSMPYLADASVDTIFGMNVVYFLDPLPEYLAELHRVLKVGGCVNFGCKLASLPKDNDVFVNTDKDTIIDQMAAAGFDVSSEVIRVSETDKTYDYLEVKGIKKG